MEVLVVGNTAYVDDDFCAKAFPGDHVQVVAAQDARRDESSPQASWKELLLHLDQAYEFDRVVYLSNYLTPHTDIFGDIELLRSVFRACMGRRVQLLYVAGPRVPRVPLMPRGERARALSRTQPTTCAATTLLARAFRPRSCACRSCIPRLPRWRTRFWCRCSTHAQPDRLLCRARRMRRFPCCVPRSFRCWYAVSSTAGMVTLRRST